MSVALDGPRPSFRFVGRSFMAFVLTPDTSKDRWLDQMEGWIATSSGFFTGRPFVLDLSRSPVTQPQAADMVAWLKAKGIRIIAVEGCDADWFGPDLAPIASGGRNTEIVSPREIRSHEKIARLERTAREIEQGLAAMTGPQKAPARPVVAANISQTGPGPVLPDSGPPTAPSGNSLLLTKPVRSGQVISCPHGDITVLGAVASGAELIAGGSIHIYGPLRGRAIAGAGGNSQAQIFCQTFEAELVVIDGLYKTADDVADTLKSVAVRAWRDGDRLNIDRLCATS